MISFTILTSTPAVLRNQLIARDVLQQVTFTDPHSGQQVTQLVGVREGLEWVEVPNPIVTTAAVGERFLADGTLNPAYVPAVMDTRHAYLVKLVRAAEDNEEAGLQQDDDGIGPGGGTIKVKRPLADRTKLGQWVKANSVPETVTSADGKSWPALRVGNNFWLLNSDDFGTWQ